eukprot:CAMPEP_0181222930 /NCGR_PEP_ID=MMETSP1096-20121128/30239_1 /TAXON_ID=156174 ORGANISM="Chrysochromulina ericina, Strain CCMP281" /NCGR_SAMPLE_ID=MMETSP1096 /ASSEMBLY_ACC=CAM_ASM_000453 /LENGTH=64 /DNA_ID=CAMNT_0023315745 /DNA_START=635 /DNA_END=825 /DNA_ORIENTATION=+
MTVEASPPKSTAWAASSATAPLLASGTAPCECRQRPWLSTHSTPVTPGLDMASAHTASMRQGFS